MTNRTWVFVAALLVAAGALFVVKPKAVRADDGCVASSLTGPFGYSMNGYVYDRFGNYYFLSAVGRLTSDGNGALTGADTLSLDGTVGKRKYTGTYTVNADCTGSAVLTISEGTALGTGANFDLVLADGGKQIDFVQTDSSFVFSGTAKKQ
jgi:hypothetical protein